MEQPQRTRTYQCQHFDSTRWDGYQPRDSDIIVATSYKAGTTWTQAILAHLLFPDGQFPDTPANLSPWLDMNMVPLDVALDTIESQTHRRYIKTHLPLDGMRYEDKVKYVYVSRDGRDVFMSMWNHYRNYTDQMYLDLDNMPGFEDQPFPRAPDDIHTFWANWISKSYFDNEASGWPFWSHFSNVQSWWDYRDLPNIEFFHYNDMLNDLDGEMRRLANYLEIDVPEKYWPSIVDACSFASMKERAVEYTPGGGIFWKGGAQTFINKGTNGRWRDVLSEEELALYELACEKELSADCRHWLENGRSQDG